MKKRALILVILVFTLFITSCSYKPEAGEKPIETEAALRMVQSGTQGLEMRFLPDLPPRSIYDTTEFVAIAEIWNRGNHDMEPGACFVELTGYDKNLIRGVFARQPCGGGAALEGKKTYNLDGSFNQIEFKSTNNQLPFGVFEYEPTLNLVACYEYQTLANPLVCVENSLHTIASEQKSCYVRDVSTPGGQGAPVGIGYVGVDMAGERAIFEINVVNYGNGRVLSPYTSLASCPNTLDYQDFDRVGYDVQLSGGSIIDCKPTDGLVRLTNNQGKIVCSFNIGNTASYETPLMIRLNYNYMDSLLQPTKIIKTPGYE
ncbi:hypothetical protein GOV03_02540 [Candidatus Woesearchaeota archaeon]|nr:hypothetical protein [Candidatus Woesearchaeota archaeon]